MAARRFDASYCDRMLRLSVSVGSSASSVRLYLSVVVCVCRWDLTDPYIQQIEGHRVPGRNLVIVIRLS